MHRFGSAVMLEEQYAGSLWVIRISLDYNALPHTCYELTRRKSIVCKLIVSVLGDADLPLSYQLFYMVFKRFQKLPRLFMTRNA